MGNALEFKCESCEKVTPHPAEETEHRYFRWDDEHTALFKLLFGEDLWFRRRSRRCSACGFSEDTVELTHRMLRNLIGEVDRLTQLVQTSGPSPAEVAIRYYRPICAFVSDVFGGVSALDVGDVSANDLAGLHGMVNEVLAALDSNEQQSARFAWGLWDAPLEAPRHGHTRGKLLSRLLHPSRSQCLRPAVDIIEQPLAPEAPQKEHHVDTPEGGLRLVMD